MEGMQAAVDFLSDKANRQRIMDMYNVLQDNQNDHSIEALEFHPEGVERAVYILYRTLLFLYCIVPPRKVSSVRVPLPVDIAQAVCTIKGATAGTLDTCTSSRHESTV